MLSAPYFFDGDGADNPPQAFWLNTRDAVRIRLVLWRGGDAGTVVLFTGRTEFAEKYARVAEEFVAAGFTVATCDWRGQGLSDRLSNDPMLGHVGRFADYQLDVQAMLEALNWLDAPGPRYMIGHSMGGCIGLRSLVDGLPFAAAGFSGPMWGIKTEGAKHLVAKFLPRLLTSMGLGLLYAPGTSTEPFMMTVPFGENTLTTDAAQLDEMRKLAGHDSRLTLGGPSLHWTAEAFDEMGALLSTARPDTPTRTYLGSLEDITDAKSIRQMSQNWPSEELIVIDDAKHELMMERDDVRRQVLSGYIELFNTHRPA